MGTAPMQKSNMQKRKERSKMKPNAFKRALLLIAALAVLPVSLYGCTGGTEPTPTPSASAQTGEPSYGGSVTVGIAQDLNSLDPHLASTAGTREVMFNLFEGLMKVGSDGEVVPAVASGYQVSEDGLTYTFSLREGVKFHNGETVTAADVVYSLERCAGSENEGTPLMSAFANVESVAASEDGSTVTVTLKQPSLEFIFSMTAAIIPEGSGATITEDPVGTGPFKFVSYTPQQSLVAEKFNDYWGTPAYLDKVTFQIITNTNTLVMGLKGGTLDMVIHLPNTVESEVKDSFTVQQDTMKLVQALYLNNAVKPFDDVRVRQAMYYAINVPEIIDFVSGGAGVATGTSMYPAYSKYFLPELAETYKQDTEKAKALLTEAGYPDGFTMTITVPSNYTQHVETAEVIAEQLKAVGIEVKIDPVEWATWYSEVYKGRNYEATVTGISANDMTAKEMLARYSSAHSKNFINFNDEEYDRVIAAADATLDADEQTQLYLQAERILNEQAASLWIQDLCDLVVMKPELGGFTFYRTYVLDMSTIYYYAN